MKPQLTCQLAYFNIRVLGSGAITFSKTGITCHDAEGITCL